MPIEAQPSTTSNENGTSVSCSAVLWPNIDTTGPNGITENAVNATVAEITGAMKYTTLSAVFGMISSLNGSLTPSVRLCSQPLGPTWLGPGRTAIRATTLRS